ncbi:MAG TPA: cob(I)yrinic acid a,c-diamide adenosyltransferase [Chloroflexota bacterium]|nr:cob(I)yrinic acid a,c-diamide adenosyltransferase [Chloroflexota bacterium]
MAKVTTRTGDLGYTGLLGSERVPKYDARIEALGLVDEATSALGLARASVSEPRVRSLILQQQEALYRLMAELATTPDAAGKLKMTGISEANVSALEAATEEIKRDVDIANRFIIPGGTMAGAALDLARTVIRRAERHLAQMVHRGQIGNSYVLPFVNRLSDLVFVLARYVERNQPTEAQP